MVMKLLVSSNCTIQHGQIDQRGEFLPEAANSYKKTSFGGSLEERYYITPVTLCQRAAGFSRDAGLSQRLIRRKVEL